MLQNATPLRKSAPWPPNISHEHVFCTATATENASLQIFVKCPTPAIVCGNAMKPSRFARFWQGAQSLAPAMRNELWMSKSGPRMVRFVHFDLEMCFAPQRRALFRHLNFQKWSDTEMICQFWLQNALRATTACTFSTSQLPKVVRTPSVFNILTSKCALRHNGVHFFNISTSKSGPTLNFFVNFDFEMCFAPQRRALFRHLNFQKWSENGVLCTFSLRNVLRATMACTFSTSQLPKVLRDPGALYLFTWKCVSRHIGVQVFISHLASWLRTRRFSEPTFRPSGATNHWKNTLFGDFPTLSRICICFLLTLSLRSSLIFSLLLSSSLCLCPALLFICPYCRKFDF